MLAVLLALALTSPPADRLCERVRCPRERERSSTSAVPFFEFAPVSGAGMTAACACTTPAGSKGEALTFSRASSGTCLKGSTVSGIANGDMVTCTAGQPRVMPGGTGTGGLGLLVEATRTNSFLQSQAAENAAWAVSGTVTRTADAATAPDGTATADRLQMTGAGSAISQTISGAATVSTSIFVKGNGSSGTIDIGVFTNGGVYTCAPCSFTAANWTRCTYDNISRHATSGTTIFGLWSGNGTGCTQSAAVDFFVSGMQQEAGPYTTSYIATTSAAVVRSAELADIAIALPPLTGLSLANTIVLPSGFASPVLTGTLGDGTPGAAGGSTNFFTSQVTGGNDQAVTAGAGLPTSFTGAAVSSGAHRYAVFHTGTLLSTCIDGVCGAGAAGAFSNPTFTRFRIGAYQSTVQVIDGVTKLVCIDPARCR